MRLEPRLELLSLWEAVTRYSFRAANDGDAPQWVEGDRNAANSIVDAEQLLCVVYPAIALAELTIAASGRDMPTDVLRALTPLGANDIKIIKSLVRALLQYFDRYCVDGEQDFSGGSYFSDKHNGQVPAVQDALPVVDSYSMSVTLSLSSMLLARALGEKAMSSEFKATLADLEERAGARLLAAMQGLLDSFAVDTVAEGAELRNVVARFSGMSEGALADLVVRLEPVRAGLVELGFRDVLAESSDGFFECGWSWGPTVTSPSGAPPVAVAAPYLYFSVVALDGVADLFSVDTRTSGVLTEEHRKLAERLQRRWDLTQRYWATIATFGAQGRWLLDVVPWMTSDDAESEYYSLLVTSVVIEELSRRQASSEEVGKLVRVLEELAQRGRVTRRTLLQDDPALALHSGLKVQLDFAPDQPADVGGLHWLLADYSALLFKRVVRAAGLARSHSERQRLLVLTDEVWDHLQARRFERGDAKGLFDCPGQVFPGLELPDRPSFYLTERVVEGLVSAAGAVKAPLLRNTSVAEVAEMLLGEADHLLDKRLLARASERAEPQLRQVLADARQNLSQRPGLTMALAMDVLNKMHEIERVFSDGAEL